MLVIRFFPDFIEPPDLDSWNIKPNINYFILQLVFCLCLRHSKTGCGKTGRGKAGCGKSGCGKTGRRLYGLEFERDVKVHMLCSHRF